MKLTEKEIDMAFSWRDNLLSQIDALTEENEGLRKDVLAERLEKVRLDTDVGRLKEIIGNLKQPGPCGKHPAACLVERPMTVEHGEYSTSITAVRESTCSACESERAAVEREREACGDCTHNRSDTIAALARHPEKPMLISRDALERARYHMAAALDQDIRQAKREREPEKP